MGNYCIYRKKFDIVVQTNIPPTKEEEDPQKEEEEDPQKEEEEDPQKEEEQYAENSVPVEGHCRKMSSHYTVNYPEHDKRKNSRIYNKTHNDLIHRQKIPCFICGKTNKSDGISLETHHFYCEKSAQNAIDWEKFGEFAKKCYNIQTGENIGSPFDWKEVAKNPDMFVDSKYNMIVLCKQHHRSGNKGIHHVPFPDWILQKYPKNGFQFLL
jgi:hypothetical protein